MGEYRAEFRNEDGSVRLGGRLCFTDADNVPGARWFDGGGPPDDRYGADGDYYLDDDSGAVYRKADGTWA